MIFFGDRRVDEATVEALYWMKYHGIRWSLVWDDDYECLVLDIKGSK